MGKRVGSKNKPKQKQNPKVLDPFERDALCAAMTYF